jgi:Pyridine nucleotide-disulphide oxidoreductase
MSNSEPCEVAIVGAGPYGLSLAAHLQANEISLRIFGSPMSTWQTRMPTGMFLKSEGCASNLSDLSSSFTLARYCRDNGLPYGDYALPVPLDTFIGYGLAFHSRLVPNVEEAQVLAIERRNAGFQLRLGSAEVVQARRVIVAVGLAYFENLPPIVRGLPSEYVSHSSHHADLSVFRGQDVTVLGGGQSALETAALLTESGADTRVLVRRPAIAWNPIPSAGQRSLPQRIRRPMSGLGPGLRTFFYAEMPMVFRRLPQETRVQAVRSALGPAGAWWLRQRLEDRVPILGGRAVSHAQVVGDRVRLQVEEADGVETEFLTDHVIAATGYRVNLESVPFLDVSLLTQVRRVRHGPALSAAFESSVPGLHFIGQAAAETFGPVMRFVYGTNFTSRRLTRHIVGERNGLRPRKAGVGQQRCRG